MSNEIQPGKQRSFSITLLLCFLFGGLGVHRFYTGYTLIGILQLITAGGFGIWYLIDLLSLILNKFRDSKGQDLKGYNKYLSYAVFALLILLIVFINLITWGLFD